MDHLIDSCTPKENTFNTTQTTYLFLQWCKEQHIVPGEFLLQLYCVLDKAVPKVGWLVVFGLNGPLRQYFSLYRVVSQREGERKEK